MIRQYDATDQPALIRHEDSAGLAKSALAYTCLADGLVTQIVETDEVTEAQAIVPPDGHPAAPGD